MSYNSLSNKLVKTRKPHTCWGCTKDFPVGSMLWRCTSASKQDGIASNYWCKPCQEIIEEDPNSDNSYYFGEFRDCMEEEAQS